MLLAIDVGNTNTVAGLYALDAAPASDPLAHWRWQTHAQATADELAASTDALLRLDDYSLADVTLVALSSVVPTLQEAWRGLEPRLAEGARVMVVGPGMRTGLKIGTKAPGEVGADRIVNCVAAWERYGEACIVVDFGTATTWDVLTDSGTYVGGAIAPGVGISMRALVDRAARLSSVELRVPEKVIGRDTAEHLRSGVLIGTVAQLEGMLARIRAELVADHRVPADRAVPAIATGGLSAMLLDHVDGLDAVDPDLTLRGLQLLASHR